MLKAIIAAQIGLNYQESNNKNHANIKMEGKG
jgi:hypothetical protein